MERPEYRPAGNGLAQPTPNLLEGGAEQHSIVVVEHWVGRRQKGEVGGGEGDEEGDEVGPAGPQLADRHRNDGADRHRDRQPQGASPIGPQTEVATHQVEADEVGDRERQGEGQGGTFEIKWWNVCAVTA